MRKRIRELAAAIWREHTSPLRLALGVLAGCTIGCLPLFGLHFPLCLLAAILLRLNKVVVYGAANLSIPPMIPILGFSSVQLGEWLRTGRFLNLDRGQFVWANARPLAHQFFFDWMLGGAALGMTIGLVVGTLVYLAAKRRAPAPDPIALAAATAIDDALGRARARFDAAHPRYKWYARMKYRLDPCYRAIAPHIPARALTVDLGSGLGMLPLLLVELGEERSALGIEWDRAKVDVGRAASGTLARFELREGDVHVAELPACDVITLVDMLHYYDADTQRRLLARCADVLRPGGRILIREGDGERRGGARFTRFIERLAVRIGWNRGPAVKFRPVRDLLADCAALGLVARVDEVAGRLHPGNVLIVADKLDPAAVAAAVAAAEPATDGAREDDIVGV